MKTLETVFQFQPCFHHLCDLSKSLSASGPQIPPLKLGTMKVLTSQSHRRDNIYVCPSIVPDIFILPSLDSYSVLNSILR